MNYLSKIIDYYTYRILHFFLRKNNDNEWNLEKAKNLLSLYAIIFSSVFNGVGRIRHYTTINNYGNYE